jgi:hypothetical protein
VAASSGSPLGTPYGAWGWIEAYSTIPKAFGFEAATQSQVTTYKFMLYNLTYSFSWFVSNALSVVIIAVSNGGIKC